MKPEIARLRVNVKSLAAEAKIIRQEFRRTKLQELELHRRGRVREEARYAQLALAFVRGMCYNDVEKKCSKKPDEQRLLKKINNFLEYGSKIDLLVVRNWINK